MFPKHYAAFLLLLYHLWKNVYKFLLLTFSLYVILFVDYNFLMNNIVFHNKQHYLVLGYIRRKTTFLHRFNKCSLIVGPGLKKSLASERFVVTVGCMTVWEKNNTAFWRRNSRNRCQCSWILPYFRFSLKFADSCKRVVNNFSSQPVNYPRGRGVERGKSKKPLISGIARNRAAKNGRTYPINFVC